jgi:hypothetical protein
VRQKVVSAREVLRVTATILVTVVTEMIVVMDAAEVAVAIVRLGPGVQRARPRNVLRAVALTVEAVMAVLLDLAVTMTSGLRDLMTVRSMTRGLGNAASPSTRSPSRSSRKSATSSAGSPAWWTRSSVPGTATSTRSSSG